MDINAGINIAKLSLKHSNNSVTHYRTQFFGLENDSIDTQCLLCDLIFDLPSNQILFFAHLLEKHQLIIDDMFGISSLPSYVYYWRVKFNEESMTKFCTITPIDGKSSKDKVYYLLPNCTSEDKTLRDELRRAKLEWALAQQSDERSDKSFKRGCMFCRAEFNGLRIEYLKHLSNKHNVQLGKLENLVFVDKLLDKLQNCIESLRCIYCEKLFKDRNVLKEHMRKKLHKRIDTDKKEYDQFYITNYLERQNIWQRRQHNKIDDSEEHTGFTDNEDEESSWDDWHDDSIDVTCLLCSQKNQEYTVVLDHMVAKHNFDFKKLTNDLNFYEKVKVVNYLRRQTHDKKCIYCDKNLEEDTDHMSSQNHYKLPPNEVWNQPNFYFPMNDTDSFLYHLDSNSDDEDNGIAESPDNQQFEKNH